MSMRFFRRGNSAPWQHSRSWPRIFFHVPPWMVPFVAMTLPFWRQLAIQRHWEFNQECEGGCPIRWRSHMDAIRWEYGF